MAITYSNQPLAMNGMNGMTARSRQTARVRRSQKRGRAIDFTAVLIAAAALFAAVRFAAAPMGTLGDLVGDGGEEGSGLFEKLSSVLSVSSLAASGYGSPSEKVAGEDLPEPITAALSRGVLIPYQPLDGAVTSGFADREDPFGTGAYEFHRGIDLSAAHDVDVRAYLDGVVETASYNDSYGNYLLIRHSDGFETLYAHCDALFVSEGDSVTGGEIIARAGNTGRSTAAHLHFEVRLDGVPVDPAPYLA